MPASLPASTSHADRLCAAIDRLNAAVGHLVAWLTLAMVLAQFAVVLLRYVFGVGFIALQEAVVWMHALTFLLAAAWTLSDDAHVRVDVFLRGASARARAWVDLVGVTVFLWPFCALLLLRGYPYVAASWRALEASKETSGLPALYLLKSAMLAMPALVAVQGLAIAIRCLLVIAGRRQTHATSAASIPGGDRP